MKNKAEYWQERTDVYRKSYAMIDSDGLFKGFLSEKVNTIKHERILEYDEGKDVYRDGKQKTIWIKRQKVLETIEISREETQPNWNKFKHLTKKGKVMPLHTSKLELMKVISGNPSKR